MVEEYNIYCTVPVLYPTNHSSHRSARPSIARPRAHNQKPACPAQHSPHYASHKATPRARRANARPAAAAACARRGRPRSGCTGRAAAARGGAGACARVASALVFLGSRRRSCAGTSRLRGRATRRLVGSLLLWTMMRPARPWLWL